MLWLCVTRGETQRDLLPDVPQVDQVEVWLYPQLPHCGLFATQPAAATVMVSRNWPPLWVGAQLAGVGAPPPGHVFAVRLEKLSWMDGLVVTGFPAASTTCICICRVYTEVVPAGQLLGNVMLSVITTKWSGGPTTLPGAVAAAGRTGHAGGGEFASVHTCRYWGTLVAAEVTSSAPAATPVTSPLLTVPTLVWLLVQVAEPV
jgi:hypothetical protein